jgi:decaprenylphospho-beta-D-ribofuranose 2-oxidase
VEQVLSGWGRCPVVSARELRSEDLAALTRDVVLTRGLGRSYGDASLPAKAGERVAGSRLADRVIAFDPGTGLLRAEAGLALRDVNRTFLPHGWFVPVTPGTQFVTLGGMAASDVHGKNHHSGGTFGRHVRRLRLRTGGGDIVEASPDVETDLFDASIGGMGLTGHLLEVDVTLKRVPSPWISGETEAVPDLETLIGRMLEDGRTWPYTLAWMDAIGAGGRGRGVLYRGRWAEAEEAAGRGRLTWPRDTEFPAALPYWAFSRAGMRAFNQLVALRYGRGVRRSIQHPQTFFYPLDSLLHWNRAYGARGFTQYQCVVPHRAGIAACRRLFATIHARGGTPYVVVVKDLGAEGRGRLSFPCPGITFSIDMPVSAETQGIVDALNDIVAAEGGRIYLSKDAFTREAHYRAMDPRVDGFNAIRRRWDPEGRIRSALSVRLLGDRA